MNHNIFLILRAQKHPFSAGEGNSCLSSPVYQNIITQYNNNNTNTNNTNKINNNNNNKLKYNSNNKN